MLKRLLILIATFVAIAQTSHAASLLPPGKLCLTDPDGHPLASGTVTFYIPSTTTPKTTWQDPNQSTANSNPVPLDSSGCAIIYGVGSYRQIVKDSSGVTIWDELTADPSQNSPLWGGTGAGTANAQTVSIGGFSSVSGQIVFYLASATNTSALTVNAISVVKDTLAGPVALTGGEVTSGNVVGLVYEAGVGRFHLISTPQQTVDYQTFTTTGANTWTKPAWALSNSLVHWECWGGGGGGGANATGGGGGGGAYVDLWVPASSLGSTVAITVGIAGAVSTAGQNTTVTGLFTAGGGGRGENAASGGGGGGGGRGDAAANPVGGNGGASGTTNGGTGGAGSVASGGAGGASGGVGNSSYGGAGGGGGGTAGGGGGGGAGWFGGGGGGGGGTSTAGIGGESFYGGGGGGGAGTASFGGNSTYGGDGGATGIAGTAPGGGGGRNAAGARGECRVTTIK